MTTLDASGKRPCENIAGKGKIAGNNPLFLFQQCFLPHKTKGP